MALAGCGLLMVGRLQWQGLYARKFMPALDTLDMIGRAGQIGNANGTWCGAATKVITRPAWDPAPISDDKLKRFESCA